MIEKTEYFRTSLFYLSVNAAQTWYLKTTEICALTVLGARSWKSRCLHGHAPSQVSKGESFLACSSSRPCLAYDCISSLSACLHLPFFPEPSVSFLSLIRTFSLDLGLSLIQHFLSFILNWISSAKAFQIRSYPEVPGGSELRGQCSYPL